MSVRRSVDELTSHLSPLLGNPFGHLENVFVAFTFPQELPMLGDRKRLTCSTYRHIVDSARFD
jgi:hypothetical protein